MVGGIFFTTKKAAVQMRRDPAHDRAVFIDVSSYSTQASMLSPMQSYRARIPVPGMQHRRSFTVESIWQGLKVIDGKTALDLFDAKRPKKRRVENYPETRFLYGDAEIGIVEARYQIYEPAYRFMLDNLVPLTLLENMLRTAEAGVDQYIFDVIDNPDINNPERSYAHAMSVVLHLNRAYQTVRSPQPSIESLMTSDGLTDEQYNEIAETVEVTSKNLFLPRRVADFGAMLYEALLNAVDDDEIRHEKFGHAVEMYAREKGYTTQPLHSPDCLAKEIEFSEDWSYTRVKKAVLRNLYYSEPSLQLIKNG